MAALEPDDPAVAGAIERLRRAQLPVVVLLLALGLGGLAVGSRLADLPLLLATLGAFVPAALASVRAIRARRLGVDVIAVVAMIGALLLGEYLAGAIIALMLTGGEALEAHAAGRARRELTELLRREPRIAHVDRDGRLVDVPVDEVAVGDVVVVKGGEVVPADGLLVSRSGVLDRAALTGESRPVDVDLGAPVQSGEVNCGAPIELRVTAPAEASTYRGIMRMVEQAAGERAPFVRMADRSASWFVGITAVVAIGAWIAAGDPVRALAVVVVATPCPLILAAPAAIVGGLSRAARHGIIVKGGGALEVLASGTVVLLDKTGTVTTGRPVVSRVTPIGDADGDLALRLAASLDQASVHPFAPAIVDAAHGRGMQLTFPSDVVEDLGHGIRGSVEDVEVALGQLEYVDPDPSGPPALRRLQRRSALEGTSLVYVALGGELTAVLTLRDPIRRDAPGAIRALRRAGAEHVLMVTGDRLEVAEPVADMLGIDDVMADRRPEDKLAAVEDARRLGVTVMVGDGINDAPALALADVGVAMGTRGATAASEAADVVLTTGELRSLPEAVEIANRTRRIAWQSVVAGMGLSVLAMGAAAAGYLPPVAGALLQELIDVAVITNALRAVAAPLVLHRHTPVTVPEHILAEHRELAVRVADLGELAERLPELDAGTAIRELQHVRGELVHARLPHDTEEELTVYAAVSRARRGHEPTAALARSRREISRRVRLFARLVDALPADGPTHEDVPDLQRSLWGLHALLELHDLIEDDLHDQLGVTGPTSGRGRAPGRDGRRPRRGRRASTPTAAGASPPPRSPVPARGSELPG